MNGINLLTLLVFWTLLTKSFDRTKVQNFKLMYQQLRMPLFLGKYDFKTKFHSSLLQMLITLKNLSFHVIFSCRELRGSFCTLQDIAWLKSITNLPVLIKGVLTSEDGKNFPIFLALLD